MINSRPATKPPSAPQAGTAEPLTVAGLSVTYSVRRERNTAIQGVSFTIPTGESLCLVGSPGAGKSTILGALLGLLPPTASTSGTIRLPGGPTHAGVDASELLAYRRNSVGTVFQDPVGSLTPAVPILRQVAAAYRVRHGVGKKQAIDLATEALRRVGLSDSGGTYLATPRELSGGMCQRVAVALALSAPSLRLILADEPTSNVDAVVAAQILDLILELQDSQQAILIWITHDIRLHSRFNHVGVLANGQLVEYGKAAEFALGPTSDEGRRLVTASRRLGFVRENK